MLKCASLFTGEIDDCEAALSEIRSQLDSNLKLMANTVGIIMCHTEFILSGTLKYVCDNLPFDIVGVTTSSQAVNESVGDMILTIFVITADDVVFKTGLTDCLLDDYAEPTKRAYKTVSEGMEEEPKLALIFPPLILKYAGDVYPKIWGEILPNTPNFGTIAIDDTVSFDNSETIYNGDNYKTRMPFVLCYGNINPRFLIGTLPESSAMPYKAEVTRSSGPFVSEINNDNAYKYFEEKGFAANGSPTDSFLFVPFMIDQKNAADYDGIPVIRVLTAFTENGTAIFRGDVDENSIFTLLNCTGDDIVDSTISKIDEINSLNDINGFLSFSCIIRKMMMGIDTLRELNGIKDNIKLDVPFMVGYAGGEICPTSVNNGIAANRFHNYSLITLII